MTAIVYALEGLLFTNKCVDVTVIHTKTITRFILFLKVEQCATITYSYI